MYNIIQNNTKQTTSGWDTLKYINFVKECKGSLNQTINNTHSIYTTTQRFNSHSLYVCNVTHNLILCTWYQFGHQRFVTYLVHSIMVHHSNWVPTSKPRVPTSKPQTITGPHFWTCDSPLSTYWHKWCMKYKVMQQQQHLWFHF